MSLQWQTCSDAPEAMRRGSAVSHDKMAYFNPWASTAVYQFEEDQWTALPKCPHCYSALTVVNKQLTTVGGRHGPRGGGPTNSLASLTGEGKDRKWVEHFPRMPTSRYHLAAVCRGTSLIAAGGLGGGGFVVGLRTVEVMDTESLQWTLVNPLPHPMYWASIAVSQEKVYLLGGFDQNVHETLSVFSCSTLQTQPLDAQLEKPANQLTGWHQVADATHYYSTAVCVGEVLLAIGGQSAAGATSAIAAYNPTSDSWEDMGHMTTPRSWPLVALLPSNELIVAGGYGGATKVEIGKIVA